MEKTMQKTIKAKKWEEMENSLNNLFWHIRVCEESKVNLCKGVILTELKSMKHNFDYIDNH